MHRTSFEAPPFVVWRLDGNKDERPQYRLAPHGVFKHIWLQCVVQWLASLVVLHQLVEFHCLSLASASALFFSAFVIVIFVSMFANWVVLRILNSRPMQTIEALLHLSPKNARAIYEEAFPSIRNRHVRPLKITLYTFLYFLFGERASRLPVLRRRLKSVNFTRLSALTLRREDSCLHAFSAFAAVTYFVPHRRSYMPIQPIPTRFLLCYFSPIGFGFLLCIAMFCVHPIAWRLIGGNDFSRVPFMVCVLIWAVQGLIYLLFTLRADFTSLFRNYFNVRPFPNSMTSFANSQMARAPNLTAVVQDTWVPWAIATVLFGLAGLYAGFLHSLGN